MSAWISLSSFRDRLDIIKSVKLEWSNPQKQLLENGLSSKQAQLLQSETFKNKLLRIVKQFGGQIVKQFGGPFTCEEEVDVFLTLDTKEELKQKRLKAEIQYFRETCVLFDKSHALFKLMNTTGSKRKTKTFQELGHNLKLLFGKTSSQDDEGSSTLSLFRDALSKRLKMQEEF